MQAASAGRTGARLGLWGGRVALLYSTVPCSQVTRGGKERQGAREMDRQRWGCGKEKGGRRRDTESGRATGHRDPGQAQALGREAPETGGEGGPWGPHGAQQLTAALTWQTEPPPASHEATSLRGLSSCQEEKSCSSPWTVTAKEPHGISLSPLEKGQGASAVITNSTGRSWPRRLSTLHPVTRTF